MSGSRWKDVWARRELDPTRPSLLAQLMAADGLDTPFGSPSETAWRRFVDHVATTLDLPAGASVFEIGCGAGGFLYPLYERGHPVAGLDASAALIRYASEAMPEGRFRCEEATAFDPDEGPWDVVVSCGVFIYFPTLEYAREVIGRAVAGARRGVAILDVPDAARQDAALAARRAAIGEGYDERYAGLDHLYYDRTWLLDELRAAGALDAHAEDQDVEGYGNSAFRFNAFARVR